MEFTHVELEGSAMQEGITSHGGLGAASLGFTATAHAALKGGAAVRLSVTDKTLQGVRGSCTPPPAALARLPPWAPPRV